VCSLSLSHRFKNTCWVLNSPPTLEFKCGIFPEIFIRKHEKKKKKTKREREREIKRDEERNE